MSKDLPYVQSEFIGEAFGAICEKLSIVLLKCPKLSFRMICWKTHLPTSKVKEGICVLLQHNLCKYERSSKGEILYYISSSDVFAMQDFSRFVYYIKILFGDTAEHIAFLLLIYGQMTERQIIKRVIETSPEITSKQAEEALSQLRNTLFVVRSWLDEELQISKASDECSATTSAPPPKRARVIRDSDSDDEKNDAHYVLNIDRCYVHCRDEIILSYIATHFNVRASEVVREILRLSQLQPTIAGDTKCPPVEKHKLLHQLHKNMEISNTEADSYLSALTSSENNIVIRGRDRHDTFQVDFGKAIQLLAQNEVNSFVRDRFGANGARVFRIVFDTKFIEQRRLEELAMLPAKDCKEITYTLLAQDMIRTKEVPRMPDYVPSRTFYLLYADLRCAVIKLLEWCYACNYRTIVKRRLIVKEHRRLLDKFKKLEAIAQTLQSAADIQEVRDNMPEAERDSLTLMARQCNKLEASELQLHRTIVVCKHYLNFLRSNV